MFFAMTARDVSGEEVSQIYAANSLRSRCVGPYLVERTFDLNDGDA